MASSKIKSNIEGIWKDVPSQPNPSIAKLRYMIRNGICYVMAYDNASYTFTVRTWVRMGTLPENARPAENVYGSFNTRHGQGGEFVVEADGDIMINSSVSDSIFLSTSLAVPIK